MKLKNNDPGKIWAKSDKRFKSYDQKVHFWAKKGIFRNRVPESNYPVPGYPDFCNYPVLVTRFLTSLPLASLICAAFFVGQVKLPADRLGGDEIRLSLVVVAGPVLIGRHQGGCSRGGLSKILFLPL